MTKQNVAVAVENEINEDAILAGVLDEIIEDAPVEEHEIVAAVADIEKAEAVEAIYADQDSDSTETVATDKPKTKKAKAAKAPKEPKEPKEPRVTRVGNRGHESRILQARLGDKASELLLLETTDISLDPEDLKARQEAVLADIDALAVKVGEKATMLFGWMKNGGKLNEVMERTFRVLATDGELTSGNKGNLQTNLLNKPYSPGTAASQANQMFMLLPALKITMKEKGRMVANPESLIFMKAKAELGLG